MVTEGMVNLEVADYELELHWPNPTLAPVAGNQRFVISLIHCIFTLYPFTDPWTTLGRSLEASL